MAEQRREPMESIWHVPLPEKYACLGASTRAVGGRAPRADPAMAIVNAHDQESSATKTAPKNTFRLAWHA
eukprot:2612623-Lingulodinium_polyedra.AAC.1